MSMTLLIERRNYTITFQLFPNGSILKIVMMIMAMYFLIQETKNITN